MSIDIVGDPRIEKHHHNPNLVEIWFFFDEELDDEWLDRLGLRKKFRIHTTFKSWRREVGNCLVLEVEKHDAPEKYGNFIHQLAKWVYEANHPK